MQVKAKAKYIKIAPRKARLVAGVIRGLDVELALSKLAIMDKRAVKPISKLLNSAIANAEHNYELNRANLFVEQIAVNDGPTAFRWMPKAFGRATPIRHRTSIIDIVLSEKTPTAEKKKAKAAKKETENITATEKAVDNSIEADAKKKVVKTFKDEKKVATRKGSEKSLIKKVFRRKTGM